MLIREIESRLQTAATEALPEIDPAEVLIRPCPNPQFGDYQSTSIMAQAKKLRRNPRELAQAVVEKLRVDDLCQSVELAGPGFINFRLRPEAILRELQQQATSEGPLFYEPASQPRTIIIDFSSPNVAKPMHVGHIRSTILGDCLARIYRMLGHRVITDNHIGDWGTQFGMLIVGWKRYLDREHLAQDPMAELERLYKLVNSQCETDEALLEIARTELVKLQQGDSENRAIWQEMIRISMEHFQKIYDRLDVRFDYTLGESFYNDRLPGVVEELVRLGIARESDGAIVVFFDNDPELSKHPAIIRKRDGGFNYATTDLATLAYRLETWNPDEIIYITDARQQLHFKQIFAIFRRWHPEARVKLTHVWFGTILGEDGRPFKTRSGDTVKLEELLDEAEERAFQLVTEKNPSLDEEERHRIARAVGIGAVKYADLLPNRQTDYVFSWDKMLSLTGNTAPYLQYAYARIRSIFRKYEEQGGRLDPAQAAAQLQLTEETEWKLARHFLNFGLTLEMVAEEYRPNYLCNYLYDLAGKFTDFYESCPVLRSESPVRESRLLLADLTARLLRTGLHALGIQTIERM